MVCRSHILKLDWLVFSKPVLLELIYFFYKLYFDFLEFYNHQQEMSILFNKLQIDISTNKKKLLLANQCY